MKKYLIGIIIGVIVLISIIAIIIEYPAGKTNANKCTSFKNCSLSLCDCKCYTKGQRPEDVENKTCNTDCRKEYNIAGCKCQAEECMPVYMK